ncbi:hypothetical protein C0Q70_00474 [Pomacea canaliculata]|uniref:Tubulin polyglutamylase complex subunit 1-like C-terminal domain-containing protein n=2 Tax=Pomacea canaliculata TaxID=400727 RepID=A0A2T7PWR6_POMCA|nr:hypothetical protein C0Q70_00474 [Pomacea canaliculata]
MAERRKPATNDDKSLETDRQFLERTHINVLLRELLGKIIANRPEDPVVFLADFFQSQLAEHQSSQSQVQRAVKLLCMTHHSQPVFELNVREAYDLLMKQKINKNLRGINGTLYTELLWELCRTLPSSVAMRLMKKLECYDHEAVTFNVFKSSVFTCCIFREFVNIAEKLFASLDIHKNGKPDNVLCEAVIGQLKVALGSSSSDVKRIIESSYNVGPEVLHQALERAFATSKVHGFYNSEQFVAEACETFLSKV